MTSTRADEIRAEIQKTKRAINGAEHSVTRSSDPATIEALEMYAAAKSARLSKLEDMLRREEAPRVRPEGKCVTLESNGVEWKV